MLGLFWHRVFVLHGVYRTVSISAGWCPRLDLWSADGLHYITLHYIIRILQIIVLLFNYCFILNYFEWYMCFCYKIYRSVMTKSTCSFHSTLRTSEGMYVFAFVCFEGLITKCIYAIII